MTSLSGTFPVRIRPELLDYRSLDCVTIEVPLVSDSDAFTGDVVAGPKL